MKNHVVNVSALQPILPLLRWLNFAVVAQFTRLCPVKLHLWTLKFKFHVISHVTKDYAPQEMSKLHVPATLPLAHPAPTPQFSMPTAPICSTSSHSAQDEIVLFIYVFLFTLFLFTWQCELNGNTETLFNLSSALIFSCCTWSLVSAHNFFKSNNGISIVNPHSPYNYFHSSACF